MSDIHEQLGTAEQHFNWREQMARDEILDMEVVDQHPVPTGPQDALIAFGDPSQGIAKASRIADQLGEIVRAKNLAVKIQGREHLKIEGWMTLGAMCGVVAASAWTKADENGYAARSEVIRLATGEVISAAESRCDFSEQLQRRDGTLYDRWDRNEPHSCMSMAQTRSASKALAQVLRWIPGLAGFSGTPAEEMPRERDPEPPQRASDPPWPVSPLSASGGQVREPAPRGESPPRKISEPQRKRLWAIWSKRYEAQCPDGSSAGKEHSLRNILGAFGVEHTRDIQAAEYDAIVSACEEWISPDAAPSDQNWEAAP